MRTEKQDTETRRDQIAQAALDLIAEKGVQGLSVARIAHRIGLVPSAIYRHYKGKDQILDAILDVIRDRLTANVEAVLQETPEPLEQLRRLAHRHVEVIRANRAIPQVIFSREIYGGEARRRDKVYRVIRRYLGQVEGMIRRGQETGAVQPHLDPEATSVLFLGLIQPPAILWTLSDGRFDVTRQVERGWRLFEKAVTTP